MVTRFAPSPTGYLHLGHALSALLVWQFARRNNARFLLRIEDIDPDRSRPHFEFAIYEDLSWLGLEWETPVGRQSDHLPDYADALSRLQSSGVVYPCFCSRRQVAEGLYPGTCRELSPSACDDRIAAGERPCWRLHSQRAASLTGPLWWQDAAAGRILVNSADYGDVVIARRDVPASYHLAVTVDDHQQGITHVIRGLDLFSSTPVHRTLQALLGFETPEYSHHPLLLDPSTGRKLSKRDNSTSLQSLRANGLTLERLHQAAVSEDWNYLHMLFNSGSKKF